MAMNLGGGGGKGPAPQMNVTPLVDVVLVLLIIFMVVTPLLTKTFWVHTPKQEKEEVEKKDLEQDPDPPLVMRLAADRTITVNGATVSVEELVPRLKRMFAAREDHILFFDAADEAPYGLAMEILDRAREGGAVTIAPLTEALSASAGDVSTPPAAEPAS